MNKLTFPIVILALMLNDAVYAITPQSLYGGSGVGLMRTAEVLGEGESSWSIFAQTEENINTLTPGTKTAQLQVNVGYATAVGKYTELGLVVPFSVFSPLPGTTYSGGRGVDGFVKYSFTQPVENEGFGSAITVSSRLMPGSATNNISSGESLYGTELNFSYWTKSTGFHLNLGYAYDEIWAEGVTPVYTADNTMSVSAGFDLGFSDVMIFSVQGLGRRVISTSDDNLLITAGLSYAISTTSSIQLSTGFGIPSSRSNPNKNITVGWNYSPQSSRRSRYELTGVSEQLNTQNAKLLTKLDTMEQRMHRLEEKLPSQDGAMSPAGMAGDANEVAVVSSDMMAAGTPGTAIRIALINTTKNKLLLEKLVQELEAVGYLVISTQASKGKKQRVSTIYYRTGLSHEGIELGHRLKGNQVVINKDLMDGVDLRLQV
ncbi:MAG: LytR C-terminal domain-containing protein, partial [Gammaproteobacteria bacterium]|nr:LytR C-terminal domain-containing protein [Gammaproteobacteria bacterium]